MFEREIQFIYDFNYNKVKKLGSFITYEQLQHSEIHPAILQYISGEIDFLIFEDRQKLLKDSLFDYSGESISNYFSLISEEIKKTKRFSQNYIDKLILHATSFTIHFLSRPNWSMLKFIFDDEQNKSILEVKQLFNYFYYYPFLKKVMLSYFDKKNIKSISYDELNALLLKVDGIGIESNYSKVVEDSLNAMSEFYNVGMSNRKYIPVQAVELYLKEKNLTPFLKRMGEEFINPEVTRYDISEYKNAFTGLVIEFSDSVEEQQEVTDDLEFEEAHEPEKITSFDTFGQDPPAETNYDESSNEDEIILDEKINVEENESNVLEVEEDQSPPEDLLIEAEPPSLLDKEDVEVSEPQPGESELPDDDSLEIDIAEDERIDGDSLQEGLEYIKEENEITKLKRDNIEVTDEASNQHLDESDENNLVFDHDDDELDNIKETPKLASDLLDRELDDAKALYLEETDQMSKLEEELLDDPDNITIEMADESLEMSEEDSSEQSPSDVLDEAILSLEKSLDDIDVEPDEPIVPLILEKEAIEDEEPSSDNESLELEPDDEIEEVSETKLNEIDQGSVRTVEPELSEAEIDELLRAGDKEASEADEPEILGFPDPDVNKGSSNLKDITTSADKEIDEIEGLNEPLNQENESNDFEDSELEESELKTNEEYDDIQSNSLLDEKEIEEDELELFKEDPADVLQSSIDNDEELKEAEDESIIEESLVEEDIEEQNEDVIEEESSDLTHIDEPIEYKQEIESENSTGTIDLTELLENKKMNKIVESVFDYDMEDFANAIEKIAEARNKDDALLIIEKICETAQVGSKSKEAKLFKSIIADYFDQ